MKITQLEARDLPEAWFLCLRAVLATGREYTIDRGSYTEATGGARVGLPRVAEVIPPRRLTPTRQMALGRVRNARSVANSKTRRTMCRGL